MPHDVRDAVEADLKALPEDLQNSGFAAIARTLADALDNEKTSATAKSLCSKQLADILDRLRALAPDEQQEGRLELLQSKLAARRPAA